MMKWQANVHNWDFTAASAAQSKMNAVKLKRLRAMWFSLDCKLLVQTRSMSGKSIWTGMNCSTTSLLHLEINRCKLISAEKDRNNILDDYDSEDSIKMARRKFAQFEKDDKEKTMIAVYLYNQFPVERLKQKHWLNFIKLSCCPETPAWLLN